MTTLKQTKDRDEMIAQIAMQANYYGIPGTIEDISKVVDWLHRQEFPEIKNLLWGDSFWSDSKFVATTGQVSLDVLMKYVESQNEPRKK